jgi:hypothetical protein
MRMPRVTIMLDLVVDKDCLTNMRRQSMLAIKPCLWQHCSGWRNHQNRLFASHFLWEGSRH